MLYDGSTILFRIYICLFRVEQTRIDGNKYEKTKKKHACYALFGYEDRLELVRGDHRTENAIKLFKSMTLMSSRPTQHKHMPLNV